MTKKPSARDPVTHRSPAQDRAHDHSAAHIAIVDRAESAPAEIKKRDERNRNRHKFMQQGRVHLHDGRDIDHIRPLAKGGTNDPSNLRVISSSANRRKRDKPA